MLMGEIMQNLREISFICTSNTRFCILLGGTVVSPMSASYLNLLFHREPWRGLHSFPYKAEVFLHEVGREEGSKCFSFKKFAWN